MTDTTKTIALVVIVAIVGIVSYLVFSNSEGATETDPTKVSHGGAGSTILCFIYPPACVKK